MRKFFRLESWRPSRVPVSAVADEDLRVSLESDVADDLVVVAIAADQVHPGINVGARRVVEHVEVGRQRQAVLWIVVVVLPAQFVIDAGCKFKQLAMRRTEDRFLVGLYR